MLEHEIIKLLHFAPEVPFYNFFKKFKNIYYYPVDFNPEIYEARNIHIRDKVDMENLAQYEDEMFDFIYHCHVLEHIPNDLKAMNELYRVLKKGGACITLVPLYNRVCPLMNKSVSMWAKDPNEIEISQRPIITNKSITHNHNCLILI